MNMDIDINMEHDHEHDIDNGRSVCATQVPTLRPTSRKPNGAAQAPAFFW